MAEAELRRGRQTPTSSLVLPYEQTLGNEAIELYEKTGRTAQEWQRLLVYDIMARNSEQLWTHSRFGYAVPRQNGKNEIVSIREMWGLKKGERILHTAHRTATSRAAWERLKTLLDDAKITYKASGAIGLERITCKETGGVISFRTRSKGGGLGESYDLLIVDEAQEYTGIVGITEVDWLGVLSAGAFGAVISILLALKGLPEVDDVETKPPEGNNEY